MIARRIYYSLKPYIPWGVRMAMRRIRGRRLRGQNTATWPINETAGVKPPGWRGWPEGKKFAFILTHDVEGPEGVEKCRALAEVEMEFGFRSSFNFIPEGSYSVTRELRDWLTLNGFEVGVHDLHHDGKLYSSRESFAQSATRINRYLAEWNATGFRSGFMLHELDWIHDLRIAYDASTFDTDPFEPQPDAAGTIFPFWVAPKQPGRTAGYVELPYSLAQDSTLFLVLQEKTPDIWLRKLDWVAGKGGMALLNLHPDYVAFGGACPKAHEFSVEHYASLLRYVRDSCASSYWHVLPRELASWYRAEYVNQQAVAV